ncbi:MAG: hypothetical protein ACRCW2_16390 [Cellulosilyticaceae bacterium]
MTQKNHNTSSEETPIQLPLAAMLPVENVGAGIATPINNPGTGLTEYLGWRMFEEDTTK